MSRAALALAIMLAGCGPAALGGCAPAAPDVIVIGPGPPDSFRAEPHDAMASLDVAGALDVAAEAMLPVAGYLAAVHRRLHAAFAEGTLVEFEKTRPPLERDLAATLDFSLARADGKLADFRLLEASGVDTFDGAVIAGAVRASPFGAPPDEIVAFDDRVHVAWRLHRKTADPCALRDAALRAEP